MTRLAGSAAALFILTGCLMSPDLNSPIMFDDAPLFAMACVDSIIPEPDGRACDAASMATVGFSIPNTFAPAAPGCTLVLASSYGTSARFENWNGYPALADIDAVWSTLFEDCPDGFDPATGLER